MPPTLLSLIPARCAPDYCLRRGHGVSSKVFRKGAGAHNPGGGGPGGVPHPRGRGQGAVPGGARWPVRDRSRPLHALTEREKEILKLFAQGLTYQEIGQIRGTSGLTVRNAMSGIERKLGFKNRQQLVVWAVRYGLVDELQP